MRVSYPNVLDRKLKHTGGDIFIHGSCVTIGCIPHQPLRASIDAGGRYRFAR